MCLSMNIIKKSFWELGLPIVYLFYLPPRIPTMAVDQSEGRLKVVHKILGLKLKWLQGGK